MGYEGRREVHVRVYSKDNFNIVKEIFLINNLTIGRRQNYLISASCNKYHSVSDYMAFDSF